MERLRWLWAILVTRRRLRAAEIVLGTPLEIVTASFEDIATVLGDKLDADEVAPAGRDREVGTADDSVDNLPGPGQRRTRRACGQ